MIRVWYGDNFGETGVLLQFYWVQFVKTQTMSDTNSSTNLYLELDRRHFRSSSFTLLTLADSLALHWCCLWESSVSAFSFEPFNSNQFSFVLIIFLAKRLLSILATCSNHFCCLFLMAHGISSLAPTCLCNIIHLYYHKALWSYIF